MLASLDWCYQQKYAFYLLKSISRLWPSLSASEAETLIHTLVTSSLACCNGTQLSPGLECVQNSAAGVLTHTKCWQPFTPTRIHLPLLPVRSVQCSYYKLSSYCVLAFYVPYFYMFALLTSVICERNRSFTLLRREDNV